MRKDSGPTNLATPSMFMSEPMFKKAPVPPPPPPPPMETVTTSDSADSKADDDDPLDPIGGGGIIFPRSPDCRKDCRKRPVRPGLYGTGDSTSTIASFAYASSRSLATTASLTASQHDDDKPIKHVHFHSDLTTLAVDPAVQELTEEEMHEIWWTIPDFKAFRKYCRKQSNKANDDSAFMDGFQFVYEACHSGDLLKQLKWQSEHGNSNRSNNDMADTASLEDCIKIVNSKYRGLEMAIFRPLLKDRRTAVRTVLAIQNKLPSSKSLQEREVILASKSRFLTRKARQLARVMGSADALAAEEAQAAAPSVPMTEET